MATKNRQTEGTAAEAAAPAHPHHGGVYVRQADGSIAAIEGGPPPEPAPQEAPATPGAEDEK